MDEEHDFPATNVFSGLVDPQQALRAAQRVRSCTQGRRHSHWSEMLIEELRPEPISEMHLDDAQSPGFSAER